eukprot:GHVU01105373.1.p1 GENE.GHVU01105373.1~~GHVU01105373.1.p1  ORF type:complete len:1280 (+),score=283.51 GHVU01105373.1:560-3841(+)
MTTTSSTMGAGVVEALSGEWVGCLRALSALGRVRRAILEPANAMGAALLAMLDNNLQVSLASSARTDANKATKTHYGPVNPRAMTMTAANELSTTTTMTRLTSSVSLVGSAGRSADAVARSEAAGRSGSIRRALLHYLLSQSELQRQGGDTYGALQSAYEAHERCCDWYYLVGAAAPSSSAAEWNPRRLQPRAQLPNSVMAAAVSGVMGASSIAGEAVLGLPVPRGGPTGTLAGQGRRLPSGAIEALGDANSSSSVVNVDVLRSAFQAARCFWDLKQPRRAVEIGVRVAYDCRNLLRGDVWFSSQANAADGDVRAFAVDAIAAAGTWLHFAKWRTLSAIREEFDVSSALEDPYCSAASRIAFAGLIDNEVDALQSGAVESFAPTGYGLSKEGAETLVKEYRECSAELETLMKQLRSPGLAAAAKQAAMSSRGLLQTRKQDIKTVLAQRKHFDECVVSSVELHVRAMEEQYGGLRRPDPKKPNDPPAAAGGVVNSESPGGAPDSAAVAAYQSASRLLRYWFEDGPRVAEVNKFISSMGVGSLAAVFRPFIYQIASRAVEPASTPHEESVIRVLHKLVAAYPFHCVYPIIGLSNGNMVPETTKQQLVVDARKLKAAQRVLAKVKGVGDALRRVVEAAQGAAHLYTEVGLSSSEGKADLKLSAMPSARAALPLLQWIPLPTLEPDDDAPVFEANTPAEDLRRYVRETFGVTTNVNEVVAFADTGITKPKIIKATTSDGRQHRQVVKGEDLRQDAVMEQLFKTMNGVFGSVRSTRRHGLRMRTYTVRPLSPIVGVVQWVDQTEPLGRVLLGPPTRPQQGAHHRYRPLDMPSAEARDYMRRARERGLQELRPAFDHVCSRIQPVMHYILLEQFPDASDWVDGLSRYSKSVAVNSIVGYIVGLGDRHNNNILIDMKSAELVHIDFGVAFESGKRLCVPERVPFRLTRDVVRGLGCLGTEGPFRAQCEAVMQVLRDEAALVLSILQVLVLDPLYNWSLDRGNGRQRDPGNAWRQPRTVPMGVGAGAHNNNNNNPNQDGAAGGENLHARRALLSVRQKLRGLDDSASLTPMPVPAQVHTLLTEATDRERLSSMFCGWAAWL